MLDMAGWTHQTTTVKMADTEVTGSDGEAVEAVEKMASKGTTVCDPALEAQKREGKSTPGEAAHQNCT